MTEREIALRYGANPHQRPARASRADGALPFVVRNGSPGYINLLDALNAWQLVRELRRATGQPAAASFKHVSPAGAAVATPLDGALRRAYFVGDLELSPLATAYARARGADRVSSFGDVAALSEVCDVATARLLRREVSDGVIAPGYEPEALALLAAKREGRYLVLEIDPAYQPSADERRDVFGVTLEQRRNDQAIDGTLLANVVTRSRDLPEGARRDLLVALATVKYTQSNSVVLALGGQAVGVGAGQQSRIACTRLATEKAEHWWLRQHPAVLGLRFPAATPRPTRDNAIDEHVRERLSPEERRAWLARLAGVALASDAFFPFADNVERAARSGVRCIAQPGGSARDAEVIAAADARGIVMAFTGVRLFHH